MILFHHEEPFVQWKKGTWMFKVLNGTTDANKGPLFLRVGFERPGITTKNHKKNSKHLKCTKVQQTHIARLYKYKRMLCQH